MVKAYAVRDEELLKLLNHQKAIMESGADIIKTDVDPVSLFDPAPTSDTPDAPKPTSDKTNFRKNFERNNKSIRSIGSFFGCSEHNNRNVMMYHAPSTMSWHTNSDCGGKRVYLSYTYGKSVFRYIEDGNVVDSYDEPFTWMAREFTLSEDRDNLLWHTVATNSSRISIGYEIKP